MDVKRFMEFAGAANVIPVFREVLADRDTPVGLLYKLGDRVRFLLESVEGGERWGRYSILGLEPAGHVELYPDKAYVEFLGRKEEELPEGDPFRVLRRWMQRFRPAEVPGLPRFSSGFVGYLAYELVHYLERMPPIKNEALRHPLAYWFLTQELIVFDNVRHTMKVLVNVYLENGEDPEHCHRQALHRIDAILEDIKSTAPWTDSTENETEPPRPVPDDSAFMEQVRTAQEYIRAGEAIQVVLSREFSAAAHAPSTDLYRALRHVNPSPYLFLIKTPHLDLIGSSPEVMVRKERNRVTVRPIAGTRRRGASEQEDRELAHELLNDPKERAEHVMLVDLGRNDLGRVARMGTVQVTEYMAVERYSHVMHLVSNVSAELDRDKDCFDVIVATFPAGTLTGAPKVRAMEIIHEMEDRPRGPYGGAIGYIGYNGEMDLGITIRTLVRYPDRLTWRAGAGIVFDSVPERECEETMSKGKAMERALVLAQRGFRL